MAMFGGGDSLPGGGFHRDVMEANPMDQASKKSLCEEIKSRAKASLSTKNYPEAVTLYGKAIDVMNTWGDSSENSYLCILYANRSMCNLGLNKNV